MLPILETNRENILAAIIRFRNQLADLEDDLMRADFKSLQEILDRAAEHKALLTGD